MWLCACVACFFLCGGLELLVYDSNHTLLSSFSRGSVGLLAVVWVVLVPLSYDIRRVPTAAALFVLWFAAAVRADVVASRKAEPNATLWPDVCLWERLHFYCTVCVGDTCSGSSVLRIATAAAKRASLFPPVLLMRVVFAVWLVRCFCRLSSLIHTGMAARGCCLLRCCHSSCGRRVFRSCGCVVF